MSVAGFSRDLRLFAGFNGRLTDLRLTRRSLILVAAGTADPHSAKTRIDRGLVASDPFPFRRLFLRPIIKRR